VPAGETAEVRIRLVAASAAPELGDGFASTMRQREAEADAYWATLTPASAGPEEARVLRQGFAGLLWSKQFYHLDVDRWLDGDPTQPAPPQQRLNGRNSGWRHLNNHDVLLMPDCWEYPWYAAWDLAFHCVAMAHLDPEFAKRQLLLLGREWYMHPSGQFPAYEWDFSDANPPVQAWAAMRVFEQDGSRDFAFLERKFHKLLVNFTWWVNRKDVQGDNLFSGGFLGLDNVGPFDRSALPPSVGSLEQSDGTAWMAMFALDMLQMALTLAGHDPTYADVATTFFERFAHIAEAANFEGLWNNEDGFFYDLLRRRDGTTESVRVRSMVGLVPLVAVGNVDDTVVERLPGFAERSRWFLANKPQYSRAMGSRMGPEGQHWVLSVVDRERLARVLSAMLDEAEFLSPYGIRSLSRWHRDHPFEITLDGRTFRVDYEPAESRSGLFGGNSNWRGPVWFPLNFLLVESLRRYGSYAGEQMTFEHPTGSGLQCTLAQIADDLAARLISIFLPGPDGRRPLFGGVERLQTDPRWRDQLFFHEYFNGDDGAGLGASHQTGWTALVADLVLSRGS
jgi:hypothetical protein